MTTNEATRFVLYHNNGCSKSRTAATLLTERGVQFSIVNYLTDPPTPRTLLNIINKGTIPATMLVRFTESLAKELRLTTEDQRTDQQWCEILSNNPRLIERPIFESADRAIIGRPPELVLELLI